MKYTKEQRWDIGKLEMNVIGLGTIWEITTKKDIDAFLI